MKRGIYDFIVKQPKAFNDTITTKGGVELYLNVKFSGKKLANNICEVVATPLSFDSEIKEGYQIFVDSDIFFTVDTELGGERPNPNLIDRENGLYKVSDDTIIMYRKTPDSEWIGYKENLIVEFVENEAPKQQGLIITELPGANTTSTTNAKIVYINKELSEEEGLEVGDEIVLLHNYAVPVNIDDNAFHWIRNNEIGATVKN